MSPPKHYLKDSAKGKAQLRIQILTRIPGKIVVALFSGILVNSGILVDYTVVSRYVKGVQGGQVCMVCHVV